MPPAEHRTQHANLEKIIRLGAIAIAVLFVGLSLVGIFGAWFVDRKATDVALKGFGLIETGSGWSMPE
jgi:hypothetical protein